MPKRYPPTLGELAEKQVRGWLADENAREEVFKLIAEIEVEADIPRSFPTYHHALYYLDEVKGWFYLTPLGEKIKQEHSTQIQPLIDERRRKLDERMSVAVQVLLGPNPPTIIEY